MSDIIQQAETEVKKIEAVTKADFDALVARVESLEKGAASEIKALEAKVKALFKRIGHVF